MRIQIWFWEGKRTRSRKNCGWPWCINLDNGGFKKFLWESNKPIRKMRRNRSASGEQKVKNMEKKDWVTKKESKDRRGEPWQKVRPGCVKRLKAITGDFISWRQGKVVGERANGKWVLRWKWAKCMYTEWMHEGIRHEWTYNLSTWLRNVYTKKCVLHGWKNPVRSQDQ